MKFVKWAALISLNLLTACDDKYAYVPHEEIKAEARKLPLAERYNFYFTVFDNSNVPPNDEVKYYLVELGDPAWRYTIEHASGSVHELDQAMNILDVFGRYCTEAERRTLQEAARRLLNAGTEERKARLARVDEVCGITSKRNGPEKHWLDVPAEEGVQNGLLSEDKAGTVN